MAPVAPPIEGELWIDSDPLTPDHLRGRTVVVVFWSAGCEASLLRLQQVDELVEAGAATDDAVVAIGVHTPRMSCDDDVERLRHVLIRHRITMPVVHDRRYRTWTRYEPPGWPSTAVIDPRGRITGIAAGCHDFELIEAAFEDARHHPTGRRQHDPELEALPAVAVAVAERSARTTPGDNPARLSHPEGVAATAADSTPTRFAVADTGHDRVLVGHSDLAMAVFRVDLVITGVDQPAAVAFTDAETLAVIERGTNTVVAIDLPDGRRSLITDRLLRPTGLTVDLDGSVVITDAGDDRIHRATANRDRSGYLVAPIAGSGRTGVTAGPAGEAELAQPVGVVRTGAGLVFADAASSNLRLLTDRGEVVNITDSDLFDWGLIDGPAHRARLHRPAGLTSLPDGSVIVVDWGNNRLRRLHHRRIETLGLSGLNGPTAAVGLGGDRVLVTDTDNHRLVVVDPIRQDAWPMAIDDLRYAPSLVATALPAPADAAARQVSSGSATSAT